MTLPKIRIGFACLLFIAGLGALQAADLPLTWNPPSLNTDGTPLRDLEGSIVYYGTSAGSYQHAVDVGNTNRVVITGLEAGRTYYFAVEAYNCWDQPSELSQEISATVSLPLISDADQDNMPDSWEIANFGSVNTVGAESDSDFDGDGFSNLEEYVAGTNPVDPASGPTLTLAIQSKRITVSFEAVQAESPNRRYYSLERTDSLSKETWLPIPGYEAVPGANQIVTYVELTRKRCYYRLNVSLE
ncbi:MAG: fibronectin type III domain-containing protein [Kiritimatiellia bacterium]